MLQIKVNASKSYDVLIERGLLEQCGNLIRKICTGSSAVIVCGDNVKALYADKVEAALKSSGFEVFVFVYPHGEEAKNADTLFSLINFMAECKLCRSDIVVALGGGVTGDIAGFAAACFMRGIGYVQLPTTLLSMVDSSVGGKTAVNLESGKNLAGAFHQPSLVICDPDVLSTLPENILADGFAEVIKYALLCEPEISDMLINASENIEQIIYRCIETKRRYVERDEYDIGARQYLNLGHTVAHAIEKCSDYKISHGSAVAIGLAAITKAAEASLDCEAGTSDNLIKLLSSFGLPTDCGFEKSELCKLILSDKKKQDSSIRLVVPHKFGECSLIDIPIEKLSDYLFGGEL